MAQRPKYKDKRGNTSGGSSTGRSGQKRGGKGMTSDPDDAVDQGTMTCTTCNGSGSVGRPQAELDEDGTFAGNHTQRCGTCSGSGKIPKK